MLRNYCQVRVQRVGVSPSFRRLCHSFLSKLRMRKRSGWTAVSEANPCFLLPPWSRLTAKSLFQVIWGCTVRKNSSSPPLSLTWTGPLRSTSWPARRPRSRRMQPPTGTVRHIPAVFTGTGSMPESSTCQRMLCLLAVVSWTNGVDICQLAFRQVVLGGRLLQPLMCCVW